MRLLRPVLGLGVGTAVLFAGIGTATAGDPGQPRVQLQPATPRGTTIQPPAGTGTTGPVKPFMIQLDGPPAARSARLTRRTTGSASLAARSGRTQKAANVTAQDGVIGVAQGAGLVHRELYRVRTAYNGVAVLARPGDVARLQAIDGVRSVVPIPLAERRNSHSVPSTGAAAAWKAAAGGNTGQGIRVGVLDSGVDYVHSTFGGSGTAGDLLAARSAANNPEVDPETGPDPDFEAKNGAGDTLYPNDAVVGGYDFVGDDYDSRYVETSVPRPDPNPMDCPLAEGGGHGSHVAGSMAGRGVNPDGTTYAGGYESVPPGLKLGPGVAPGAEIYSLRVFGCDGTTAFITQAIDWATDPDQDGNPIDHLDVLNISAGSGYGTPDSPERAAAQEASELGVAVVISAGNNGNSTYTVGSPGVAPAALTVANISSGDWRDQVTVDAPGTDADGVHEGQHGGGFSWTALPGDVTAPLVRAPAGNLSGCAPYGTSLTGRIVVVDVRPAPGAAMPCSSMVRAEHAEAADATGVVMINADDAYEPGIWGSEQIPFVQVTAPVGAKLLAAIDSGPAPTLTFAPERVGVIYDPASADTVDPTSSRGPGIGGLLKPEIAAPGQSISSASSGTGSGATVMGGTSMAAPHVSGAMALVRKHRPLWSVEELKALLVNTARPQVHVAPGHAGRREAPQRVGSGALDVATALDATAVAYAADAEGAVAVGFGLLRVPVGAPFTVERTVRVANKAAGLRTFTVAFDAITDVPGVGWELPDGDTVTVAGGATKDLRIRLRIDDPTALRHARDETIGESHDHEGELVRQRWLAEASGLLRLTESGPDAGPALSVPVHAAVRPSAATASAATAVELPADQVDGALTFAGPTVDTGRTSSDFLATRMAFEWQGSSPRLPEQDGKRPPARADIEHVGVTAHDGWISFGISTWGAVPAPTTPTTVQVLIDADGDGEADFGIAPNRIEGTDAFRTCVTSAADPETPTCVPMLLNRMAEEGGFYDSRLTVLSVPAALVGLTGDATEFAYHVITADDLAEGVVDQLGPLTFDAAEPALRFGVGATVDGGDAGLHADVAGDLPFRLDPERLTATPTSGALVFHMLGAPEQQTETIAVSQAAPVDPVDPIDPPPYVPPPFKLPPPFQPPPYVPPPFVPHDLHKPQPPIERQRRLPKHRRTSNVAGGKLTITATRKCVKPNGAFTVKLSGKRRSRDAKFARIVRTEFRLDKKRIRTDRKAPFQHRVRVKRLKPGSTHRVTARSVIELRDGKRMRKSVTVRFRVCG
ncbi:MAG: S8 family serine peptidase [Patulibacter sp.]|nr:S8 family serine peptidase [Patulibacter sp.]